MRKNVKDSRITACVIGAAVLMLAAGVLDFTGSMKFFDGSFLFGHPSHFHNILHDVSFTAGVMLLLASFALASLHAHQAQWRLELQNEELRRETNARVRLASAIEQSAESIVIADPKGIIQYVNPAFESLTGYSKSEIIGQSAAFLKGGDQDGQDYRDLLRTITRGETWRGNFVNRRKDGTECEVSAVISCVFDDSGAVVNYIAAQHDVTVQANLEKQLRQSQKMEVMGTFAGHIAHDFNNILALILGHSEMALRHLSDRDPIRGHVERIEKAGRRASKLIKQMLTFSRQIEQERKPVKIHLVVREVLDFLRASLPSTIQLGESAADCGMVMADATQIHQVVMNLCTNACQALQEGQGALDVVLDVVEIGPNGTPGVEKLAPGPYVRLCVRDTGSGIEPTVLPHIFEPFFTTKKPGEGTGLGLSTVHGIVAGHGGAIAVRSGVGQGSTFEIYLPRLDGAFQATIPEQGPPVGGRERILLVDDSEEIAEMASMSLEQMGYSVTTFSSSVNAFEHFRASPQDYDLVITDQVMPDMTGAVLARELLALRPGLPIILISGFGQGLTPEQARIIGISEYLMKPFSGKVLSDAIRRVLQGGEAGTASA
jgi:PAS domain S-box-containing protein